MPYKAKCNGCGYDGGTNGDDWQVTLSAYTWGRCPKCGTTNLDVEVICDRCGTKETEIMGTGTRCLKCFPEPSTILAEAWTRYADTVIPKGSPRLQYVESRRAFYAGAHSAFTGFMAMLEPGTEPTEQDLAKVTALKAEIDKFYEDVSAGRA